MLGGWYPSLSGVALGEGIPEQSKAKPPFWVVTAYFAEGFPYSLVRQISTVYFKDHGASLGAVGLTSLFGLPWVLKFLWAPLLDAVWTKRRWMLLCEAALALGALAMALASASPSALALGGWVFLACAFLSATHDIGVDGFYLEALDRKQQALFVGFQAMAYRLALIAGGGGVVWFSGVASWPAAFLLASGILAGLCAFHAATLPKVERERAPLAQVVRRLAEPRVAATALGGVALAALAAWGSSLAPRIKDVPGGVGEFLGKLGVPGLIGLVLLAGLLGLLLFLPRLRRSLATSDALYAKAFVDWLDQPRIGIVLAFLLLYRTGESILLAMVYPLLKEIGLSRADYGIAYGTLGIAASIAGGLAGGALIARYGLRRVIWPLVLAQNVPNLLYAGLAWAYCGTGKSVSLAVVAPLVMIEALGAGMGTSAFMVFTQRTCKSDFRAAHFAIATSVMNVSATFGGALSGFLAASTGFPLFFVLTFAATIPSMLLIPFLPHLKERPSE